MRGQHDFELCPIEMSARQSHCYVLIATVSPRSALGLVVGTGVRNGSKRGH